MWRIVFLLPERLPTAGRLRWFWKFGRFPIELHWEWINPALQPFLTVALAIMVTVVASM